MTPNATASAQRFRAAIETGDIAATALFTEDAVFNSPVVHKPYQGREPLGQILRAAFTVFENFRYTAEYSGPGGHVLEFAARVEDLQVHGVDILRAGGADGMLTELTVLARPYSAATALRERMAAVLSG